MVFLVINVHLDNNYMLLVTKGSIKIKNEKTIRDCQHEDDYQVQCSCQYWNLDVKAYAVLCLLCNLCPVVTDGQIR